MLLNGVPVVLNEKRTLFHIPSFLRPPIRLSLTYEKTTLPFMGRVVLLE